MKKPFLTLLLCSTLCFSQSPQETKDKDAILKVLLTQQAAWNAYDLEGYMEPYWKSENLTFYGSSGVVKGWHNTMDRYKKSYPSKDHFGQLELSAKDISKIDDGAYTVLGEYRLNRPVGNTGGIFMLVLKRMDGKWKIIADTSCTVE